MHACSDLQVHSRDVCLNILRLRAEFQQNLLQNLRNILRVSRKGLKQCFGSAAVISVSTASHVYSSALLLTVLLVGDSR